MRKLKQLFDRFKRDVRIYFTPTSVVEVLIDGHHTENYSYDRCTQTVYIYEKRNTNHPKWWQFWKKKIDTELKIKLTRP